MKKILICFIYSLYALNAFSQKDNLNTTKINGLKGKVKKYTKYQYEPLPTEKSIQQFPLDKQHLITKSVVYFGDDGVETKQFTYKQDANDMHFAFSCISTHNLITNNKTLIIHKWNRPHMNSDQQNEVDSVIVTWVSNNDCFIETKSSIWGDHSLYPMLFVDTISLDHSMNVTSVKTEVIDLNGKKGNHKRNDYITKYSYDGGKLFLIYNTSPYAFGVPEEKSYHIGNVKYDKYGNITEYTAFVSINQINHIIRTMKFDYEYY